MPKQQVQDFSKIIADKLIHSDAFLKAQTILCYISFDNEVMTYLILQAAWDAAKTVTVPYINENGEMQCAKIGSLDDTEKGTYGILEPKSPCVAFDKSRLDLIVVPGVGFDKTGGRLGFGKGYYDRFMQGISAEKIGICYEFQILEHLELQKHDILMDRILTEKNEYTRMR